MTSEEIQEINNAIRSPSAKWNADETSLTKIPRAERLKHLGYIPGPKDKSVKERESQRLIFRNSTQPLQLQQRFLSNMISNLGGQNYIAPIRDQGGLIV